MVTRPDLSNIDLVTFDCYGTLIDWETGILAVLSPVLSAHGLTMSNENLLALYAKLESSAEQGAYRPYREILAMVMRQLAENLEFQLQGDEEHTLSDSIKNWPCFADTQTALRFLRKHVKLAVISNIDDDLFVASHKRLGVTLDYVITAEQARAYKPSRKVFDYAFSRLPFLPGQVLYVAQSLYHDIAPCNKIGIDCVWVNRRKGMSGSGATPPATAQPTWQVGNMAELVELLIE